MKWKLRETRTCERSLPACTLFSSQLISCRSHSQPCMTGPLEGQLVNRDLLVLPEQLGRLGLVCQGAGNHQAL